MNRIALKTQVLWTWQCPTCGHPNLESLRFGLHDEGLYACEQCHTVSHIDVTVGITTSAPLPTDIPIERLYYGAATGLYF